MKLKRVFGGRECTLLHLHSHPLPRYLFLRSRELFLCSSSNSIRVHRLYRLHYPRTTLVLPYDYPSTTLVLP